VFFKSNHPAALYRWYEEHLGLARVKYGAVSFEWREEHPLERRE
jgi:hypothetical protein